MWYFISNDRTPLRLWFVAASTILSLFIIFVTHLRGGKEDPARPASNLNLLRVTIVVRNNCTMRRKHESAIVLPETKLAVRRFSVYYQLQKEKAILSSISFIRAIITRDKLVG